MDGLKNCKDKTVEFEVNGEENRKKLSILLKIVTKGPIFSKVSKIDIKW